MSSGTGKKTSANESQLLSGLSDRRRRQEENLTQSVSIHSEKQNRKVFSTQETKTLTTLPSLRIKKFRHDSECSY